jgi:dihydrodipicolinate synthase/N-acetylneuraminate lyase
MKTSPVTVDDLSRSVIAVPPLARSTDGTLSRSGNTMLLDHISRGGISTVMYGGNANLYHQPVSELEDLLSLLTELVARDTWLIPAIGPDYGKLLDAASIVKDSRVPTVLLLPAASAVTPAGVATGVRRIAERMQKPVFLYINTDQYIRVEDARALIEDGLVCAIKYGIPRAVPGEDRYLQQLIDAVDRRRIVSGLGERPVLAHVGQFGLASFTSGLACIAPNAARHLLAQLRHGDLAAAAETHGHFLPLEDLRDAIGPISVIHDAMTLAGIADTGPLLPFLSNIPMSSIKRVRAAAEALRDYDRKCEMAARITP